MQQIQDVGLRVLELRSLLGPGSKYHRSKLKFIALKWAVCNHFKDYLKIYRLHFDVCNDFNPLKYIKTTCTLNATGKIWVNELTDFNF